MIDQRLFEIIVDSFRKILLPGLTMTIPLTAISFFFALIIALIVAMIQFAHVRVLRQVARFYVWVIRGTPLLVQLFVVFYGMPNIGILIDPFPAAVIVFSINEGAYMAEIIRAALESVPAGQMEAGALRRHDLSADDAPHHPAAGDAHGLPVAVQLADLDD